MVKQITAFPINLSKQINYESITIKGFVVDVDFQPYTYIYSMTKAIAIQNTHL